MQRNKPHIERVQALADISHSALCCHRNETRAPIANPPICAQLEGTPYQHPTLHSGPCSSVGMRRGTNTQTHRRPWPLYISLRLRLTQSVISKVNESSKWQYQSYTINLPAAVSCNVGRSVWTEAEIVHRFRWSRDLLQWAVGLHQQRRRRLFVLKQISRHNMSS